MIGRVTVIRSASMVLALSLLLISPIQTFAETNPAPAKGGITISPPLQQIVIGPGLVQANTTISLRNNTNHDINANLKTVDFKALDAFGGISLGQAGVPIAKYGLADWMTLPGGNSVTLPSGKTTNVTILIDNRADLAPGGHYGALVVTVAANSGRAGNNVSFKQQLVSLLFVKKTGGEQYGLDLQTLRVKSDSDLPSTAELRFKSTGNVHVVPRGYVAVYDPSGKMIAKGVINPESTLVLPGATRQFVTVLQPVTSSSLNGRYKVTAYYRYDGQNQFSSKSIYFTRGSLLPKIVLATLLTGAIIGLTLLLYRKFHTSKRKRS